MGNNNKPKEQCRIYSEWHPYQECKPYKLMKLKQEVEKEFNA